MDDELLVYYVDDLVDSLLEDYLVHYCSKLSDEFGVRIEYREFTFDHSAGLESLISDDELRRASTIVIDSLLFEAENAREGMFTGESVRLLLKRFLPFSDVLVISRQSNTEYEDFGIYKKINRDDYASREAAFVEYDKTLGAAVRLSVEASIQFRKIAKRVNQDGVLREYGIERAIDSLLGVESYRNITSEDIDELVACFKELKAVFGT